jgi:hypothetical protein
MKETSLVLIRRVRIPPAELDMHDPGLQKGGPVTEDNISPRFQAFVCVQPRCDAYVLFAADARAGDSRPATFVQPLRRGSVRNTDDGACGYAKQRSPRLSPSIIDSDSFLFLVTAGI